MIIFFICITLLILGYKFYSPFVEKQAGIDPTVSTPQTRFNEGVDYVPIHPVRAFLIQFLNIAGVGPIFGPILGALYGPVALVWIVIGNVLGGAVHDYFSGVMSIKEDGKSLPEIAGHYYNIVFKGFMLIFTAMLLFFVGVVFIMSPAGLLSNLDSFQGTMLADNTFWVLVILGYYFLATLLPIDKIITKFYPIFGLLMIVMTSMIAIALLIDAPHLPMAGDFLAYFEADHAHDFLAPNPDGLPTWPLLFITITCGAISGFHSTQAPIIARCLTNEKYVRPVYYGAMMCEGIVACVWALAGIAAFPEGYGQLKDMLDAGGPGLVVNHVANTYLGVLGGIMAIVAVAVFPITSGDTAFRSLRLTLVDAFSIPQSIRNRLLLAVPILTIAYFMTKLDFTVIWRYFAFSNMLLSTSVLWLATKYLFDRGTFHWIASIPAVIASGVTISYIMTAAIGFNLSADLGKPIGAVVVVVGLVLLVLAHNKHKQIAA
ncbi:MAG: carbon starvation protein A [Alteromonadaceae bacterium]|jgi:carbon starvation protein CstA|uniref:Carbon starvation protein A n=2 Tax=Paraglaciecola chathamensis TaxID=368405 RepID=A0A8H9IEB6_9ALTE|nr:MULTISPECIES: carbon starvation CstA family protein [Paraglaciecola]AEE24234.1 carbon starvation protein CstA [Glaciecola sp. 4H-3-7+YE-5]MBN28246.1 carbon starvation protein A [Alteromonadaceae bacterium]MBJ2135061.1 carbon starvation protein A [Paraglaciecola chathamensis]GAC07465.1 carbon starvation protein CstA [Paraglaciecola agarilytica NO2]GGZ66256.1 carbon starvation protein A [Paraglaciecola oceanifecundans]|tara:strand:- start:25853 stop:27316 length:1464 start_codon:yes stop_codon:yes gene_type:complete